MISTISRRRKLLMTLSSFVLTGLGISACTHSPVPGMHFASSLQSKDPGGVRYSTVIAGIKCELATAMVQIDKNYDKSDIRYQSFILYPGTVTVTANTQNVDLGNGKIGVVLPFNLLNKITPGGALTLTTTATKETKLKFQTSSFADDNTICGTKELRNVNTGGVIAGALLATHEEFVNIPSRGMKLDKKNRKVNDAYAPLLRPDTLDLTVSFNVAKKAEASGSIEFITERFRIPNPTQNYTPEANLSSERTDKVTVAINFPLKRGQPPPDQRRIITCGAPNTSGVFRCLDRPFDPKLDNQPES